MPIYEYRCTDCKRKFEQIVLRGKALDDASCPRCGSLAIERLLSTFSVSGVSRKSEESFDDDFDAPDADFESDLGGDDLGDDEEMGYGEGGGLGDSPLDPGLDGDLEDEELA